MAPEILLIPIDIKIPFVSKRLVDVYLGLAALVGLAPVVDVVGINVIGFLEVIVATGRIAKSGQRECGIGSLDVF